MRKHLERGHQMESPSASHPRLHGVSVHCRLDFPSLSFTINFGNFFLHIVVEILLFETSPLIGYSGVLMKCKIPNKLYMPTLNILFKHRIVWNHSAVFRCKGKILYLFTSLLIGFLHCVSCIDLISDEFFMTSHFFFLKWTKT